jgi:hypothetical protein
MPIGLEASTFGNPRTVRDLIQGSYRIARVAGRGEASSNALLNEAGYTLNDLIEQANIDAPYGVHEAAITFPLVAGQVSYLIGPSLADVIATRPTTILSGFVRRDSTDYSVWITHRRQDYDAISLKSTLTNGWNTVVYYEALFPSGRLHVFPIPADGLSTLSLTVTQPLRLYVSLDEHVEIPPAYFSWLQYKLAERLAPDHGQIWSADNARILDEMEHTIQHNNMKAPPVVCIGLISLSNAGSGGGYHIGSDRVM